MSQFRHFFLISACSLMLGLSYPALSDQPLIIQDTSGFTRAASDVADSGNIEFTLADSTGAPVDGAEVRLVNSSTQESLLVKAEGGIARFESVTPGTWTVSTTATDVTFTNIAVIDALAPAAVGLGASTVQVLGIGAAGVGATAGVALGAVAITKEDDNGDEEPLPLSPVS